MNYTIDNVINGISKYINAEIYSGMNDWQEFIARLAVGRVLNNMPQIKETIINNSFIKTFGIINAEGMVDVETLAKEIKNEIANKGKLTISLPMFGSMTFKPNDVDVLYRHITGENLD